MLSFVTGEKLSHRNYKKKLDEISIEYLQKNYPYEKDYVAFKKQLEKKYAPKTVELRMVAVRGGWRARDYFQVFAI